MDIFSVGRKFSSYAEIKTALDQYMSETGETFVLKDCRRLQSHTIPRRNLRESKPNWSLGYYRLQFTCLYHGKSKHRGKGLRTHKPWRTDCKAQIRLLLTHCSKFLEVNLVDLNHNHEIVPKRPTRACLRVQRRVNQLMNDLDVPYELACQMEKEEFYIRHPEKCPLAFNSLGYQIKTTEEEFLASFTFSDSDDEPNDSMDVSNPNDVSEANINKQSSYDISTNPQAGCDNLNSEDDYTSDSSDNMQSDQIYSKVGDSGYTYTFNGSKKSKDDDIFEALGLIEELSCNVGFAIEFIPSSCEEMSKELRDIQNILQALILHVGSPKSCESFVEDCNEFHEEYVSELEKLISAHTKELNENMTTDKIILPSGGQSSSTLHVARTICRTAERKAICLVKRCDIDEIVLKFLNRLGDYLFITARIISFLSNDQEYFYADTNCE